MRTIIVVQARLASKRLPRKVLKPILDRPLLSYTFERVKCLSDCTNCVLATSTNQIDDALASFAEAHQIPCFRGDHENVLKRFYDCACEHNADTIVRITGDCPLIDPALLRQMILFYTNHFPEYDYLSNVLERSFPKGLDVEVFSFQTLTRAYQNAKTAYEKEHVTPYIYQNKSLFRLYNFTHHLNLANYNLSVDTQEDFDNVAQLIEKCYPKNPYFGIDEMAQALQEIHNL